MLFFLFDVYVLMSGKASRHGAAELVLNVFF